MVVSLVVKTHARLTTVIRFLTASSLREIPLPECKQFIRLPTCRQFRFLARMHARAQTHEHAFSRNGSFSIFEEEIR